MEKLLATFSKKFLQKTELMDNSITLPLLSYTLLSVIKTHLYEAKIPPKFVLFLSGLNDKITKECLANLFCNLFLRSGKYINTIRYCYHKHYQSSSYKIERSIKNMRDCVLIFDFKKIKTIKYTKRIFDKVIKLYTDEQDDSSGGMLLGLIDKPIYNQDIINIDIEGEVNEPLLEKYEERIYDLGLSIWFFLDKLKDQIKKYPWEKEYQEAIKKLEDENTDINLVEKYAYFFLVYKMYLEYGFEMKEVFLPNPQKHSQLLTEAVNLFKKKCTKENINLSKKIDLVYEFREYIGYLENEKMINEINRPYNENIKGWYRKKSIEANYIYLDFQNYWNDFTSYCSLKGVTIDKKNKRDLEKQLGEKKIIESQKSNSKRFDLQKTVQKNVTIKALVVNIKNLNNVC